MSTGPPSESSGSLGFLRRLETHVAVAVTLVVALALGAAWLAATRAITSGSLDRASTELDAARSAFYQLQNDRADFAAAQTTLVTALPVFRSYMTDSRLTSDFATMQAMTEDYRQQLKAAFCIVTSRSGFWLGSSGWPDGMAPPAWLEGMMAASAAGQPQRDIADVGGRLFLVVSEPARFAEETLGTLTVGYALDDSVARQLAAVTHSEVNIILGGSLAASSLSGGTREAMARLIATGQAPAPGDAALLTPLGGGEYVTGAFPLTADRQEDTAGGRLVLLQDWAPTRRYLSELQRQMFVAGLSIFAVALAGGLLFARRLSRPLKDIASAAGDIASGNWNRWVPVRGSAEAVVTARGFNEMTRSLRHWYEEAKKRDDELRQAQKMEAIGRLAAGVAHDFNNLLTAITGYSELLQHRLGAEHAAREEVGEILAAADRAAELTKQLLTFSRRRAAHPRVLALEQVVGGIEQMLHRTIGENIELITSFAPDLGRVRADRGQIEQVLLNLVVNARDAMPEGGKLHVTLANAEIGAAPHDVVHSPLPARYVKMSVGDSGHGMSPETVARIFEPFFTTKEAGRGTGLGLAVVYGIVNEAGGLIDVESAVGRGTSFNVYLPWTDEVAEAPAQGASPAPARTVKPSETVLLAEDDYGLRTLIRNTLGRAGYTVLPAANAEDALEIARSRTSPIHVLLADVVMPGMNGRRLADRVSRVHRETRVLFMSGYSEEDVTRAGVQVSGADFIQKPFSMEMLERKIQETVTANVTP